jgi:hypothetical protein
MHKSMPEEIDLPFLKVKNKNITKNKPNKQIF